jgi:hypothetical protein
LTSCPSDASIIGQLTDYICGLACSLTAADPARGARTEPGGSCRVGLSLFDAEIRTLLANGEGSRLDYLVAAKAAFRVAGARGES